VFFLFMRIYKQNKLCDFPSPGRCGDWQRNFPAEGVAEDTTKRSK